MLNNTKYKKILKPEIKKQKQSKTVKLIKNIKYYNSI